ncbi:hypothetical protein BaRGS_00007135 [Batillaria attramentaria]|uniref:Uncharacterized protein n=1 Tax=Batillaria attramentaria TaxID=370345 RepID=A0ABD0LQB7_9CAEN
MTRPDFGRHLTAPKGEQGTLVEMQGALQLARSWFNLVDRVAFKNCSIIHSKEGEALREFGNCTGKVSLEVWTVCGPPTDRSNRDSVTFPAGQANKATTT